MTDLPVKSKLVSTSTTEADFQSAIGDLYDVVSQLGVVGAPEALTISSGAITPSRGFMVIDTESLSASDDLTTITPTNIGAKMLVLKTTSAARVVTLKNNTGGTGKLLLTGGVDAVLDQTEYIITFTYSSTLNCWLETWRNWGVFAPTSSVKSASRTQLGLGSAAVLNSGAGAGDLPTNSLLGELAYLDTADISSISGSTGDISYSFAATKAGHILADGRTIGKTGSVASNRANNDTQNLYYLFWALNSTAFPLYNSSGGLITRGVSAGADWAAGNVVSVFDGRDRVLAGRGDMGGTAANRLNTLYSGMNSTILGATGGADNTVLTVGQLARHFHTAGSMATSVAGTHHHILPKYTGEGGIFPVIPSGGTTSAGNHYSDYMADNGSHSHTISGQTAEAGSGEGHSNVQPTGMVNMFIRL